MEIRTHKYAEVAFPLVKGMIADKEEDNYTTTKKLEAKYRTLALNFPTMIMQSGLAQSIGFLMAKAQDNPADESEHRKLLNHVEKILEKDVKNISSELNLYHIILKSDIYTYMLLTRKALDASSWLKRYSQALLKKENGE